MIRRSSSVGLIHNPASKVSRLLSVARVSPSEAPPSLGVVSPSHSADSSANQQQLSLASNTNTPNPSGELMLENSPDDRPSSAASQGRPSASPSPVGSLSRTLGLSKSVSAIQQQNQAAASKGPDTSDGPVQSPHLAALIKASEADLTPLAKSIQFLSLSINIIVLIVPPS